ncbi:MAG TPA: M50 family metallopeptidase [Acidobacteriaceae bacterium]|nr:M50 family metallopeptidase [Acidobacteriaceae bacterium]
MQSLRSFLSFLYGFVSASILLAMFRSPKLLLHFPGPTWEGHRAMGWIAWGFLPAIALLFGVASLTYWLRWPTAKAWTLAVASVNVATPFLLSWLLSQYGDASAQSIVNGVKFTFLLFVLGVLGFAAFWNWNRSSDKLQDVRPARVAGDGTHPTVDKLFWILVFAGYFAGMHWWGRWAHTAGLPSQSVIPSYIGVFIAELAVVLVHEAGHALSGMAMGMKVWAFVVGPFQWRIVGDRWTFTFRPAQFFATGGSTAVVPTDPHQPLSRDIPMILAGPLASLAGGLAGFWMVVRAPGHAWASWWELLAMFTTISLLAFVGNLVPFQTGTAHYSDGAQIYQILSSGPWRDFHRVLRVAGATQVTNLRPRDYDIAAIERSASVIGSGVRGFMLRLLAHSYYVDSGQPGAASLAIEQAESVYEECAEKLPAEGHYSLVTDAALQRRDAARARLSWDRAEAKKPGLLNGDYWMARSALAWIEGDLDEARSAWAKADEYLRGMPHTGAYEFDRDCLAALKKTIDTDPIVRTPELADSLRG